MFRTLAAAAAILLSAGFASASTMTFDYTNSQTNPGGPALSCQALGILNSSCSVTYNNAGLGVNGSPDTTPGQIDGFPLFSSERLIMDFGVDTVWHSITFGLWDNNDDVRLTLSDGTSFTYNGNASTLALGGAVSSSLMITAYGQPGQDGLFKGFDNFTVASIDVAPVPLPAAGFMLLAALGGLAAVRARKARS